MILERCGSPDDFVLVGIWAGGHYVCTRLAELIEKMEGSPNQKRRKISGNCEGGTEIKQARHTDRLSQSALTRHTDRVQDGHKYEL